VQVDEDIQICKYFYAYVYVYISVFVYIYVMYVCMCCVCKYVCIHPCMYVNTEHLK